MNLVFDIGANMGQTVNIFIDEAEKVIAFEPNPKLVSHLKNRFEKDNVIVDNRGISTKVGVQNFNISNYHFLSTFSNDWISNSRFNNIYSWDDVVVVQTTTLDNIIDEYGTPDYIKIDVEGYEYEILTAFTKLLDNTILSFEWAEEQKNKIIETVNYLFNLGYNKFYFTEGDEIMFNNQINWDFYDRFEFFSSLEEERKEKWGMIYIKK